jgi:hypothetical protein
MNKHFTSSITSFSLNSTRNRNNELSKFHYVFFSRILLATGIMNYLTQVVTIQLPYFNNIHPKIKTEFKTGINRILQKTSSAPSMQLLLFRQNHPHTCIHEQQDGSPMFGSPTHSSLITWGCQAKYTEG